MTCRFKIHRHPPLGLSFLVGEIVHNLRSTLDNIIWGLGQTCGEPTNSNLSFPVCTKASDFDKKAMHLQRLPKEVLALVENLQPYKYTDPKDAPLFILNRLWNDDKHRAPIIVFGIVDAHQLYLTPQQDAGILLKNIRLRTGVISDNDELLSIVVPSSKPPSDLSNAYRTEIAMDKDGPGKGRITRKLLIDLHNFTRNEVVQKFAPFFQP